jgi:hypothetical protein
VGTRTRAFGVEVVADFELPGMPPAVDGLGPLPTVDVRLGDARALAAAWSGSDVIRTSEMSFGSGMVDRFVDRHPVHGFRMYARYFGTAVVSTDGARVVCMPPAVESWRWQRFLVGRVLPLAALLRGVEIFHAAAVSVENGVVAMVAPTGGGKTSLAVALALRGAALFTDDVLGVTIVDGKPVAHPGPAVVNIRVAEEERLDTRLSTVPLLGRTAREKAHYELPVEARSLPIRAIGFVELVGAEPSSTVRLTEPEPLRLLASTFDGEIADPERLVRQLDVCSRLAMTVPMYRLLRGAGEDADQLSNLFMDAVAGDDAAT